MGDRAGGHAANDHGRDSKPGSLRSGLCLYGTRYSPVPRLHIGDSKAGAACCFYSPLEPEPSGLPHLQGEIEREREREREREKRV